MALPDTTAARLAKVATPQSIGGRVSLDHDDVFDFHAQLVGDDLRKDRIVSLPLLAQPGIDIDLAGDGVDFHMSAFVGTKSGTFDIEPKSQAEPLALAPGGSLLVDKAVPADRLPRHPERLQVLAAIVLTRRPSANSSPSRV